MTISGIGLLLAPLWPLGVALLLMAWPGLRTGLIKLAPWSALPALVMTLLPVDYSTDVIPGLLLGSQIGLDEPGRYFLVLTALVWLAAGLYAKPAFAQKERPGFFILFLLAMSGNLGVVVAADIISFYLSFALMSFAAYGLVISSGTTTALQAGRIYITFVVLGEVMLLSALLLAASQAHGYDFETIRATVAQSEHRDLIIALTIMSLGIKIGLPGLHFTLPIIYRAATIPAATALAGAMINAGVLGWLRLLPAGHISLPEWSMTLMSLGLFAAFYGVLVGLTQRDAKTMLGYSSISQMGILTFAVGLGLGAPQAWPALLMIITLYAVHHGLAKAALFIGLDMMQNGTNNRQWRWLVLLGLALPALALAGAPFTSGMIVKLLLKEQIGIAPWPEVLDWLLPLTSLATAMLLARFIYLAWSCTTEGYPQQCRWKALSWTLLVVASLLLLLLLICFLPIETQTDLLSFSMVWQSLWPVLAAAIIFFIIARWLAWQKITIAEIPAGDIFSPIQAIIKKLYTLIVNTSIVRLSRWKKLLMHYLSKVTNSANRQHPFATIELKLGRWPVAMMLFLILMLLNFLITYSAS